MKKETEMTGMSLMNDVIIITITNSQRYMKEKTGMLIPGIPLAMYSVLYWILYLTVVILKTDLVPPGLIYVKAHCLTETP